MSEILLKSQSLNYSKYFSQQEDFEKRLGKFCLNNNTFKGSKRYGTVGDGGIPLSYNQESKIVSIDDADAHSLIIGATGSKKSRLLAMPLVKILMHAKESMIITDPKAEIYNRTATELKENGYNIVTINLRNPKQGEAWNPLAIPYKFYSEGDIDKAYEFSNDIAVNLMGQNVSIKDPFWDNSASSFFFGLIMLLFKFCKENKINKKNVNISNVLSLRNFLFKDYSFGCTPNDIIHYAQCDPFIYSLLVGTIETANTTRAGILSVFDQRMRTFSIQPSLSAMLTGETILFDNIQSSPTAVFLIMPDEKTSFHNLVSLFVKQSYEYMIFKAQSSNIGNVRVNYILDEFSSLPNIHDFPAMITAARSRNIRFNLFVQSKHQLDLKYGEEANTIRANCSNWIFLVSREIALLQEISELCGVKRSEGISVPVLSVTDLQRLDKETGEALILSNRQKPYITILPDIDCYDLNDYKIPELIEYNRKISYIDFEKEIFRINENRKRFMSELSPKME